MFHFPLNDFFVWRDYTTPLQLIGMAKIICIENIVFILIELINSAGLTEYVYRKRSGAFIISLYPPLQFVLRTSSDSATGRQPVLFRKMKFFTSFKSVTTVC